MRSGLEDRTRRRRGRRVVLEATQALSVAAQMAICCPSVMDDWMRRELTGVEPARHPR